MFEQYIKIAYRNLSKNRQQSIISIIGLVVGIMAFSIVNYMVRYMRDVNTGFDTYEQLCTLSWSNGIGGSISFTTLEQARLFESTPIPGIEKVGFSTHAASAPFVFEKENEQEMVFQMQFSFINPAFLSIHAAQWIRGSSAFSQPYSAVISRSVADKVYKNENPIGKKLYITETEHLIPERVYTIQGVIEDFPEANSYSPLEHLGIFIGESHFLPAHEGVTTVMLKTPAYKTKEINNWLKSNERLTIIPEGRGGLTFFPVLNNTAENQRSASVIITYLILSSLGFLVLLAGFITFSSIYAGMFFNRIRELSLRKSLGAGWSEPFKLLFSEMALTVIAGFLLTLICSELLVPLLNTVISSLVGFRISRMTLLLHELQYFPFLLIFSALFALFASFHIHKMAVLDGVKKKGKHRFRNFMLGFQLFISLLFMGIAGLFHWQYEMNEEVVYTTLSKKEKEQIYEVNLNISQLKDKVSIIKSRLQNFKGVADILESSSTLTTSADLAYPEISEGVNQFAFLLDVSDNFSSFLNLPVLQGHFPTNDQSALITKALYEKLDADRTGSVILDTITYQVSGIVADFINMPGNDSADEMVIRRVSEINHLYVKCIPGYEKETGEFIRQTINEWIPSTIGYEIRTFKKEINDLQSGEKIFRNIFLILSILLLFITFLGIYSSITVDTVQRQKEVAIRKINGATIFDICLLFGKMYIKLLALSSLFGIPVLIIIGSKLMELIYRAPVNLFNPLFWILLLGILIVLVFITIIYRLLIIARMNPVDSIRSE